MNSLKKFLDIFLGMLFLFFLIYIFIDILNIRSTLKELQKEKIELILKNEEVVIKSLLKYGFYDELKDEIKRIIKLSPDIKNIVVEFEGKKYSFNNVTTSHKLKLDGNIVVYYSDKELLTSFFKKYTLKFLLYIVVFTPLVILIFIYIRRKILKLNILARIVRDIDFRKVKAIEKIDEYLEIVYITEAINTLLKEINRFYVNQKELLKRVVQFKKHLENAQKIAQMFSWDYECSTKAFNISKKNIKFLEEKIGNFDSFLTHLSDESRALFLSTIEKSCKDCSDFEIVLKFVNSKNKEFYLKTIGKCEKDRIIGTSLNITEEFLKQKKIEFLAYHDPLTSLANRTYLKEYFKNLISIAKRCNKKIAVLYLDLDNFKIINDTLGHENGDELLIEIAKRLTAVLRESDFISRVGGDEFVILLNDISSKDEVKKVIEKIIASLENIKLKNSKFSPTFSIGVAIYPDDSSDVQELLSFADIAMYDAKNRGKNGYSFISEDMKKSVYEYYNIINEIKDGLKNEEFILYFQPKIDVNTTKIIGAEALIRWQHPKRGLLSPFYFIEYAEKSNLITEIDRYVLRKSMEVLSTWQKDEKLKDLVLAVNVSANQFRDERFVEYLKDLITRYNIDPSKLEIEITESLGLNDISLAMMVLSYIKSLGVRVAIDDFGTGYSSLNYIKKLPFDTLKIDQTFVKELLSNKEDTAITQMIIQIAKVLNKETVAEGVESKELFEIMKRLKCDIVQGYYFSPPVDYSKFIDLVKN